MTLDYYAIGIRIKSQRSKNRMTQEHLAFLVHTSAAYISCIERATKKPSLQTLADIAQVLNISMDDLLDTHYDNENSLFYSVSKCSPNDKERLLYCCQCIIEILDDQI